MTGLRAKKAPSRQVFLLYETTPHDPHEEDRLEAVHATMDGAAKVNYQRPVHPWGRPQPDGSIEAKPYPGFTFGLKIVPIELKD